MSETHSIRPEPNLGLVEFSAIGALMAAIVALSIDIILPALDKSGAELGAPSANAAQMIITTLFLGLAVGQMIFGPISDSTGRKPVIYFGFVIFLIGCLMSYFSKDFSTMLAGRFLQGFGASAPRIVIMALVRDLYQGRSMARITSIMMGFFILIPIIAPTLGKGILYFANWRAVFLFLMLYSCIIMAWFAIRQRETLPVPLRRPFNMGGILQGIAEVLRIPVAFWYTIAAGIIFGAFNCYLISSQQIFADIFDIRDNFAYYFGALAIPIGASAIFNSALVMKYGMRHLCRLALLAIISFAAIALLISFFHQGRPPLSVFTLWAMGSFFMMGVLFGNFNAIAMEPLGERAGIGASVVGSLSIMLSMGIGAAIGALYNGTLYPLIGAFFGLGLTSLLVMFLADRKTLSA